VKLRCGIKNTGNGPAFEVKVWLLEYGRLPDLRDFEHYVAPLGPGEHYVGPAENYLGSGIGGNYDRPFVSADMSLDGREPKDESFRLLLTWKAMFFTYGESYVEEHFGNDKTKRPRIHIVYPWECIWRRMSRYDRTGRR
jgi:hypothetical protein